jgi:hypothetical protein
MPETNFFRNCRMMLADALGHHVSCAYEFTTVPSNLWRCLIIQGSGEGSGSNPITGEICAFAVDKCSEFKEGDFYLAISGDGRWKVSWVFLLVPSGGFCTR